VKTGPVEVTQARFIKQFVAKTEGLGGSRSLVGTLLSNDRHWAVCRSAGSKEVPTSSYFESSNSSQACMNWLSSTCAGASRSLIEGISVNGCGPRAVGWRLQVVLQDDRRRMKVRRSKIRVTEDGDGDSCAELKRARPKGLHEGG
jgi:hypothetical protein